MLEYLEKLAEDQEWQKVIEYSEQLLLKSENKPWDLMVIYTRLLQARFMTDEFYGAQVAGELALKMAGELQAWDYFGIAALWLANSYDRLRQPEKALATLYDYMAYLPHYETAKQHHALVLTNIGFLHARAGNFEEAIGVLEKAGQVAMASRDDRNAHGIRLRLIKVYFEVENLEQIPSLLVKCAHYLRHNPDVPDYNRSLLTYSLYRVQYAVFTDRFRRAILVARRALKLAKLPEAVDPVHSLHQLLARLYERQGNFQAALREGVRARTVAVETRRFDLEYKITDYLYGLLNAHPQLAEQVQDDHEERED